MVDQPGARRERRARCNVDPETGLQWHESYVRRLAILDSDGWRDGGVDAVVRWPFLVPSSMASSNTCGRQRARQEGFAIGLQIPVCTAKNQIACLRRLRGSKRSSSTCLWDVPVGRACGSVHRKRPRPHRTLLLLHGVSACTSLVCAGYAMRVRERRGEAADEGQRTAGHNAGVRAVGGRQAKGCRQMWRLAASRAAVVCWCSLLDLAHSCRGCLLPPFRQDALSLAGHLNFRGGQMQYAVGPLSGNLGAGSAGC